MTPVEAAPASPDDLLRRTARGDESAFAALYDVVSPRVYGLAKRVLRDPTQAEEVAQEALVEVWRTASRFDPAKGSATSWVLTITHRRAVDRVRAVQAGADRERRVAASSVETPYDDVVEEVTAGLERQQLRRCLDALTDLQREAITLAYYGGLTYRDVAEKLQTALPTIKARMRDGLIRLRDCLGAEVPGASASTGRGEPEMRSSTDIHALAGAYALDALTEIDRAAFARHLATCPSCAVEAVELTETASRLGAAAVQRAPARLRPAVLAEVGRTRQVTSGMPGRQRYGEAAWLARRWVATSIAAMIVAVAGVVTVWTVQQGRIDGVRQQAQSEQARLISVLAAGDARVATTELAGGGRMIVAVSHRLDDGVVVLSDLPATPDDKTYQIWVLTGVSAASLAVMPPHVHSGATEVATVTGADRIAVTIEPIGGSPAPTSAPIGSVALV